MKLLQRNGASYPYRKVNFLPKEPYLLKQLTMI